MYMQYCGFQYAVLHYILCMSNTHRRYALDEEGYVRIRYTPRPTFTEGALMSAVCYQQISIKVARKIHERLLAKLENPFLLTLEDLREIGCSERKAETILRIKKFFDDILYTSQFYEPGSPLSSQEVVKLFTQIKGVGDWTVKAYLLWQERRTDIALFEDLEVRKGMMVHYKLEKLPTVKEGKELCRKWPKGEESRLSLFYLQLGKLAPRSRGGKN